MHVTKMQGSECKFVRDFVHCGQAICPHKCEKNVESQMETAKSG